VAHWHAAGRIVSTSERGLAHTRRVRQLRAAPRSRIWPLRRRHAASAHIEDLKDPDLEYALISLGAYLLVRSTRDLVQRVVQSIVSRASETLT
jgi:hypothetical protein